MNIPGAFRHVRSFPAIVITTYRIAKTYFKFSWMTHRFLRKAGMVAPTDFKPDVMKTALMLKPIICFCYLCCYLSTAFHSKRRRDYALRHGKHTHTSALIFQNKYNEMVSGILSQDGVPTSSLEKVSQKLKELHWIWLFHRYNWSIQIIHAGRISVRNSQIQC